MSRTAAQTPERIRHRAMLYFWKHGYGAASIDDLVRETQASRYALYQAFGGKRGLFLACLDAYPGIAVTPAFSRVEQAGATLDDIAAFFEQQVANMEAAGFPSRGCLFANTMTEAAPHDAEIAARVRAHNQRLAAGFGAALRNSLPPGKRIAPRQIEELASLLAIGAQGLWSASRTMTGAGELRRSFTTLLDLVRQRLER
jgi:TetR/AcrR family transcriptional repressor of nem operon